MKKITHSLQDFAMITFGTAIVAAAVFFFLVPSKLSVASISGLAIVLENYIALPVSGITMILNLSLLVVGFLLVGREFGSKTVYTSILLPLSSGFWSGCFPTTLLSCRTRSWI